MNHSLLEFLGLVGMARITKRFLVNSQKPLVFSGMGIMAGTALAAGNRAVGYPLGKFGLFVTAVTDLLKAGKTPFSTNK